MIVCTAWEKCPHAGSAPENGSWALDWAKASAMGPSSSLGCRGCLGLPTHCRTAPQVSFRYHCQLYSEWRRTNQKVRLKIQDSDGSEDSHHSPLAAGLLKKVAEETPV